jgi:uncharacterized protein
MELVSIQGLNKTVAIAARNAVQDGAANSLSEVTDWQVLRNLSEIHIELTSTCNLSCSYCYAEVERPGRAFPIFSQSLFQRTVDIIASYSRKQNIEIIFHGGEPLLQSAVWYDEACSYAITTLAAAGKTCDFGMQSNLTLLRDEHIEVFIRHGVKVGTSIDGPEAVHNTVRGKFALTARNLNRLIEAGVFSGAIAVMHHHNWELVPDLYTTFSRLRIPSFHLNIASAVGNGMGALPLSADQIFRVLCDDFESMRKYDGEVIDTRLLAKLRRHIKHPTTDEFLAQLKCDNPFCHAGINMVVVKYTGEVYPCGCAGSSGNIKNFLLGNFLEDECRKDFFKDQVRRFHAKPEKYEQECRTCPARFVCEHGCPAFDINDPVTPEHHCAATKRFEQYLAAQPYAVVEHVANLIPQNIEAKHR